MRRGFSVLELLIVLAIAGLLLGVILWPFANFRDDKLLDGAGEEIISLLDGARARTLSSEGSSQYGVYFEDDKITLFKGTAFPGSGDPDNQEVAIHNRLVISEITLTGGGSSVVFKRLTGATDEAGTVVVNLSADADKKRVIKISAAGSAGLE